MAQTVCILLGDENRMRLAAIVGDRNRPQKHVQRARIVLLSADRLPVLAVGARPTPADRRYGDGSNASPRRVSTGCCATRRASPARSRCRRRPWPKSWRCRAASRPDKPLIGRAEGENHGGLTTNDRNIGSNSQHRLSDQV